MNIYYEMSPEELDARMARRRYQHAVRKLERRQRIDTLFTLGGCLMFGAVAWLIVWGVTA